MNSKKPVTYRMYRRIVNHWPVAIVAAFMVAGCDTDSDYLTPAQVGKTRAAIIVSSSGIDFSGLDDSWVRVCLTSRTEAGFESNDVANALFPGVSISSKQWLDRVESVQANFSQSLGQWDRISVLLLNRDGRLLPIPIFYEELRKFLPRGRALEMRYDAFGWHGTKSRQCHDRPFGRAACVDSSNSMLCRYMFSDEGE